MRPALGSIIILMAVLSVFGEPNCGKKEEKKKYKLHPKSMNWFGALGHCAAQGMSLATVESSEEVKKLRSQIKKYGNLTNTSKSSWWLGGSNLHNACDYMWTSTGKPMKYRHFRPGEPNYRTYKNCEREHCVEVLSGNYYTDYNWVEDWNDTVCEQKRFFICEYFE